MATSSDANCAHPEPLHSPPPASTGPPAKSQGQARRGVRSPPTGCDDGDARVWYVAIQGHCHGPMSLASLVTLAQLAAVGRDTYSWRVGFDTWYPLGCFKSLRRLLEPARPDTAPIVRSPTLRRVTSQSRASAGAAA